MADDILLQALRLAAAKSAWKAPVRTVATGNIVLEGLQTLAAVTVAEGDRVLVTGQTNAAANGLYVAAGGVWWRAEDWSADAVLAPGACVRVTEGTYRNQIWSLTSPTTGTIELGVTDLTWSESPFLSPPANLAANAADIQPALDATGRVLLQAGATYALTDDLDCPSEGTIECLDGVAYITLASSYDDSAGVATPDNRALSLIRARGAASGAVNTTLSETANQGDVQIKVVSATGITAGMRLCTRGDNAADQWSTESDSEILFEHFVVADSYVSGTTIPLKNKVTIQHAIGKPVVSWAPARNITIRGVEFIVDPTEKTVPVGIELTDVVGATIERVTGRGFSRSMLDFTGCSAVKLRNIVGRGDSNCDLAMFSCHFVDANDIEHTGEYARTHPVGIPRGLLHTNDHCVHVTIGTLRLRKFCMGWEAFGGLNCWVGLLDIQDGDCSEARTRNPNYSTNPDRIIGTGFHGGASELPEATFGEGCGIGKVLASAITQPAIGVTEWVLFPHDHFDFTLGDVQIENLGDSPQTAGSYCNGVLISDCDGHFGSIQLRGMRIGLMTENFNCNVRIDSLIINGAAGEGAPGTIGVMFDHKGGLNTSPRIGFLQCGNTPAYVYFGAEWASVPDPSLTIENVEFDGFIGSDVQVEILASGAPGDVVRIASGGATVEATGPYRAQAICLATPVASYTLVAHGNAVAKHSGSAAAKGDILEAANDGTLVVNNSPSTPYTAKWIARRESGGGYVSVGKAAM